MKTKIFDIVLGLPKSIYFCVKMLPLKQAVKLPILVSPKTKFASLQGRVELLSPAKFGMIKIGLNGSGTAKFIPTIIENNGIMQLSDCNLGGVFRYAPFQKKAL